MATDWLTLDETAEDWLLLDEEAADWLVLVTEDISHLFRWITYTAAPGLIDFTIGGPVHYTADQSLMGFTATYGMVDYTTADSRLDFTALEND